MTSLSHHPWFGDLFGCQETAALFSADAQLATLLRVEAAWTRSLGLVEGAGHAEDIARKIERLDIKPDDLCTGTTRDGIPVPALVGLIKARFPESDHAWIHRGLTSQDVMDTALMLTLRDFSGALSARLTVLRAELDKLGQVNHGRQLTAFTRMQPALPIAAPLLVENWAHPLRRLQQGLRSGIERVAVIQWGGAIGTRPHPQKERLGTLFAQALGLCDPGSCWHTDRARLIDFATLLIQLCSAVGKIGEDVVLMAALGPDHITLAQGGGSSAMAHKNNPVKAEALVTLARYAAVLSAGLHGSAVHEAFRSGRSWSLEFLTLPDLCLATAASVRIGADVIAGINALGVPESDMI